MWEDYVSLAVKNEVKNFGDSIEEKYSDVEGFKSALRDTNELASIFDMAGGNSSAAGFGRVNDKFEKKISNAEAATVSAIERAVKSYGDRIDSLIEKGNYLDIKFISESVSGWISKYSKLNISSEVKSISQKLMENSAVKEVRDAINETVLKDKEKLEAQLSDTKRKLMKLSDDIMIANQNLNSCSVLAFGKKKTLKVQIETLTNQKAEIDGSVSSIESQIKNLELQIK